SEAEEAAFWSRYDTSGLDAAEEVEVEVQPGARTRAISIRLPERLLAAIRSEAAQKDVPYQRLMRTALERRFDSAWGETAAEPRPHYGTSGARLEMIERCRERQRRAGASE